MNLYITADKIGETSGGGSVTHHESAALRSLGETIIWDREKLPGDGDDPWKWDDVACTKQDFFVNPPKLAHFYAGTFTKTVHTLVRNGCKVTYTAAAHDVDISRREHKRLGLPFDYPHLNHPDLWKRYLGGYLAADVLICPSNHSAEVMRKHGAKQPIEVIPHGVDVPEHVALLPPRFTVGYLGAIGPDKGLIYLLQAWRKLNYKNALLILAGRQSISHFMYGLVGQFGGGAICLSGWVPNISDFYNSISLYVQPSASEGFGCEVLEAMAHSRPVLCSKGAGACDVVPEAHHFEPCNVDDLADKIDALKNARYLQEIALTFREKSQQYTWSKIRERYVRLWKEFL